jgi:hypothetical protein
VSVSTWPVKTADTFSAPAQFDAVVTLVPFCKTSISSSVSVAREKPVGKVKVTVVPNAQASCKVKEND